MSTFTDETQRYFEPQLDIGNLLPLRAVTVTLECLNDTHLPFFHQGALEAYLRSLSGSPENYSRFIRMDACESGRTRYRKRDRYNFMLLTMNGGEPLLEKLLLQLRRLPGSATRRGTEIPFADNWKCVGIDDLFTGKPVSSVAELSAYDDETLDQEALLWQDYPAITWRWLTRARLVKPAPAEPGKRTGKQTFCRDGADLDGELLLTRLYDTFAALLKSRGTPPASPRGRPPPVPVERRHLFWFEDSYADIKGRVTPLGGITGRLDLRLAPPLSHAWWRLLVLGQYIGIGQRTAAGLGRYRLETLDGGVTFRRPERALPMLALAADHANVAEAWRHVMIGRDAWNTADADNEGDTFDEADEEDGGEVPLERIEKDFRRLLDGDYSIPPLTGYLRPKHNGGVRTLTVPPRYDRVLQRAVGQVLGAALERMMSSQSYGFRRGRSRLDARYAIQAAWREGYRWVYESDVADFFDSVDLERLRGRLEAIYDKDPLVDAVMAWMRAPVLFEGERIERRRGLPQGAPLSPLMANLFLDDFDGDMAAAGFRLIRFADDFIVLCKDPKEARAAGERARSSLAEHGLDLHPDKTQITAMESGFRYLGYLFVNDMAMDVGGKQGGDDKPAPHGHWLARLGEREPARLGSREQLEQFVERLGSGAAVALGERDSEGALLAVTGEPAVVSTYNRNARVVRGDQRIYDIPWSNLDTLLLFGNHQMTTQAMHAALRNDVAVHFANGQGRYRGALVNGRSSQGHRLWLDQLHAFCDPDKALHCAREVVTARLRHMKETLRQRHDSWDAAPWDSALRNIDRVADIEGLRGLEGNATREFYGHLAEVIPETWGFSGRNRRPPRDPVNVLLSLGYTVIYGYCDSTARSVGLLPWQGFYHRPRGDHAALASDLMEPFRHFAERTALTMIRRGELTPADFSADETGGCRIADAARRKFIALLLQRLDQPVKALGKEEPLRPVEHMHQQALSLRRMITNDTLFKAWRSR